jgi:hypothetical protein
VNVNYCCLWEETVCSLIRIYMLFGGIYSLHLQCIFIEILYTLSNHF